MSDATDDRQFDLLFDATIGDAAVRSFLTEASPAAAGAIAERFAEAARRGFWTSRRNSAAAIMVELGVAQ